MSQPNNIIKNRHTYESLNDFGNKDLNIFNIEVPSHLKIIDTRKLSDFKKKAFGNYEKSKIALCLDKSILNEKIEQAIFCGLQLFFCGDMKGLWNRLYNLACKQIHIMNPKLPFYLLSRLKLWNGILHQAEVVKDKNAILLLRNNQELRNILVEMITILTISRKAKLETLPRIKKEEFLVSNFKGKLEADATNYTSNIFKERDPNEIRIVANEMAYHLSNKNQKKTLYWLSWILEWEKLHISKYKKFDVGTRFYDGVDSKWQKNVIWLIWDIVLKYKKSMCDSDSQSQIDTLLELYLFKFKIGEKARRLNYILWSIKYICFSCDWKIKLVEREYYVFQTILNLNALILRIKKDEVKGDIYRHAKFNLLVKDNYITNQESLQFEAEKKKQAKVKKAKKGKISVQSLDKLEALQKLDKLMF